MNKYSYTVQKINSFSQKTPNDKMRLYILKWIKEWEKEKQLFFRIVKFLKNDYRLTLKPIYRSILLTLASWADDFSKEYLIKFYSPDLDSGNRGMIRDATISFFCKDLISDNKNFIDFENNNDMLTVNHIEDKLAQTTYRRCLMNGNCINIKVYLKKVFNFWAVYRVKYDS